MDPDPRQDVDVCNAVLAAPWAGEVVAVGQADVEHAIETLRLVDVTCK